MWRAPLPPVDHLVVLGHLTHLVGNPFRMAPAGAPAELPQLPGGPLVAVHQLVDVVGIQRAGPPAVQEGREGAERDEPPRGLKRARNVNR